MRSFPIHLKRACAWAKCPSTFGKELVLLGGHKLEAQEQIKLAVEWTTATIDTYQIGLSQLVHALPGVMQIPNATRSAG